MVKKNVRLIGTFFKSEQLPSDRFPKIVLLGRSNVGKSSLINCLLNRRDLARTSSRPGKTLSINYFLINDQFILTDLPGYGYSRIPHSEQRRVARLIGDFFDRAAAGIKAVLLLVDARRGFLASDLEVLEKIMAKNFPILTILTKSDKLSYSQLRRCINEQKNNYGLNSIPFSIKTGIGRDEIWEHIVQAMKE